MEDDCMLTTVDNPFNPFTEWDEWNRWDQDNGYFTNAYLARISLTSPHIGENDEELAIEDAIDEIIRLNPTLYRKVRPA